MAKNEAFKVYIMFSHIVETYFTVKNEVFKVYIKFSHIWGGACKNHSSAFMISKKHALATLDALTSFHHK